CLPAKHGGRVEQDDPLDLGLRAGVKEQPGTGAQRTHRVGLPPGRARDPLRDLRLDLFRDGGEQVGLVAELVIEGTAGPPGRPAAPLGPHVRNPARAEQRPGRGHQPSPGRRGAEIVLGPGHPACRISCHTYCLYVILDLPCTYRLSVCYYGTAWEDSD